jgi:WhiB family redox-sensing transcriptional regulator
MDHAACVGEANLFFSEASNPIAEDERRHAAKAFCAVCQVVADCLTYAVRTGQEYGVWGGLTAEERGLHRGT